MATAPRRSAAPLEKGEAPSFEDGRRAKALRPFEKSDSSKSLRGETLEALNAFQHAAIAFEVSTKDEVARRRLRVSAARTMSELRRELRTGALPDDLVSEVERWEDGMFEGTRADIELANYAIVALLGSDVRIGDGYAKPPSADDDLEL